ncbi:hypothetical protein [Roseovarius sp.]|uniref:hypothetical protein n=1 Tax=Roseovarius sp. TaxID=1486281 RepID=UPI003BAA1A0E
MSDLEWPREIWMAERDEHDQGVVSAVLSEHATVVRWEGDKQRDREFHRYVDEDIYDSHAKYMSVKLAEKDAAIEALQAERDRLREACNQARLAFAGFVSVESAINKLDALGDDT